MSCRIFLVSFTLPNYYSCLVEGYYLNNPLTLIYIHKPFRLLVLVSGQEIFPARHICMVMFMFSFIGFRFLWLWNDAAVVSSGNILLCSLSVSSLLGSCNIGGLIVLFNFVCRFFTSQASLVHTRWWNGNLGAQRVLGFLFRNQDIYCDCKDCSLHYHMLVNHSYLTPAVDGGTTSTSTKPFNPKQVGVG